MLGGGGGGGRASQIQVHFQKCASCHHVNVVTAHPDPFKKNLDGRCQSQLTGLTRDITSWLTTHAKIVTSKCDSVIMFHQCLLVLSVLLGMKAVLQNKIRINECSNVIKLHLFTNL